MNSSDKEEKGAYDSLAARYKSFVDHFINPRTGNFNRTEAARLAGYSPKTAYSQGSRLLKHVEISKAISERLRENAMSADEALSRLSGWARGSFHPFLEANEKGEVRVRLTTDAAKSNLHLIKKIEQTERITRSGGDAEEKVLKTKIELYDAMDATVQIAKINGQFVDKVEHSGAVHTGVRVIDFTEEEES